MSYLAFLGLMVGCGCVCLMGLAISNLLLNQRIHDLRELLNIQSGLLNGELLSVEQRLTALCDQIDVLWSERDTIQIRTRLLWDAHQQKKEAAGRGAAVDVQHPLEASDVSKDES